MHKSRAPNTIPPFRRILSSIGIYNYNLSKYLCSLQQPNIPTDYCAKYTFTFVKKIQNFKSMHGKYMVSFDVESLFTIVPLYESIEHAVKYILSNNLTIKLTNDELKRLFYIATSHTHFFI